MELETLQAFMKVAEAGSFTQAGRLLGLPKSSISRLVSRLEAEMATQLFRRTTRSLALTDAGQRLFHECYEPLRILEEARRTVIGDDKSLSGKIKLTAPEDLGKRALNEVVSQLAVKHPGLNFEVLLTDVRIDLIKENVDLAVRIGKLEVSSLKTTKIGDIALGIVASKKTLDSVGKIREPSDLEKVKCLSFFPRTSSYRWTLKSSSQRTEELNIFPAVVANHMTTLLDLALRHVGFALVPLYLCREHLMSERLVRVLPQWEGPSFPVSVVTPGSTNKNVRLKIVREAVVNSVRHEIRTIE